ncbi:MAG: diaminopropionate ammonia-lyase [Tissierellaceae bacterium]|nr:diaminopropionate ammonia-lyase [Tissierellaceae bacterium]
MTFKHELIKANLVSVRNDNPKASVSFISEETIKKVNEFHKGFDEYSVTPLHNLEGLANHFGVKSIFLKDESYRFGLNAFKVLGGAYAVGHYLADKLGIDISEVSFEYLKSKEVKDKLGEITFVTATDGNHGRGVAWAANQLGQKSVVYMPRGSSPIRLNNIRKEGSDASIIDGNYEEAVALSDEMAKKNGWVVIQDTAWEGYEDIPTWIMQGYGTLIYEAMNQLEDYGIDKPTHVFLQAGVGSFAGAILGYLVDKFGDDRPTTIIVEPDDANCLYISSLSGKREIVEGDMPTIMAGLACGAPNTVSYEILKDYADGYLSCPDYVAARGMRILAAPLKGDPQVVSGESGAVGTGVITLLMERDEYKDLREKLRLDENSVVLLISTEGDTDPKKYRDIVWDGDHQSTK